MTSLHSLFLDCQNGHLKSVEGALQSGEVGVNSTDESGITAAQVAAANDQVAVLKLLVKYNGNLDAQNNVGWTPLHQGCWHGHTETVQYLLEQGVDLNKRNRYESSALILASASGHLSTVRLLLEAGARPDGPAKGTATCPTPLLTAAIHGRDGVIRMLLNRGVRPDSVAVPSQWTPLMAAAAGGSRPCCQLLLERSADPNKMNLVGARALDIATGAENTDVRIYLESKTQQIKKNHVEHQQIGLIQAAREGDIAKVEALLAEKDSNVDVQDQDGATPLILAAVGGFAGITKRLLGSGADINHQDKVNGWTALMQATFYCHVEVVKMLLEHKADLTMTGHNGCSALDLATLVDDKSCGLVRLLAQFTIEKCPPSLILTPTRLPPKPRSAPEPRPFSSRYQDVLQPNGLKGLWSKLSRKFRKPENSPRLDFDGGFGETTQILGVQADENGLGIQSLVSATPVFTLGFTLSLTNTAQSMLFSSPPNFRHLLHDTSCSPGKFCMPAGKPGTEATPATLYPSSVKLLNYSRSTTSSPATSKLSSNKRSRKKIRKIYNKTLKQDKELTVQFILKKLNLQHLYPNFIEQEIDLNVFINISNEDLLEIGVKNVEERNKILLYLSSHVIV